MSKKKHEEEDTAAEMFIDQILKDGAPIPLHLFLIWILICSASWMANCENQISKPSANIYESSKKVSIYPFSNIYVICGTFH